jgi:hypothetical protein
MKVNKLADGVFSRIVGNTREISSYDRFMNVEDTISSNEGVKKHLVPYKELISKNKSIFQKLAQYEDLIMLYRIRENLDIQLSTQREYVYARQSCPRSDTRNQDIRICIAKTEFHDVNNLQSDVVLMEKASKKIRDQIDGLIYEKERALATRAVRKSKQNL